MRKAFTLLEMMVASLLLGMLVTVLTMIFNQSSIAWRTGISSVAELGETRQSLGTFREICDDLLPGAGETSSGAGDSRNLNYRTVSPWQKDGDGLRTRALEQVDTWGKAPQISISDAKVGAFKEITAAGSGQQASLFTVGVRSLGPDGKPDTLDDITTWPESIE